MVWILWYVLYIHALEAFLQVWLVTPSPLLCVAVHDNDLLFLGVSSQLLQRFGHQLWLFSLAKLFPCLIYSKLFPTF